MKKFTLLLKLFFSNYFESSFNFWKLFFIFITPFLFPSSSSYSPAETCKKKQVITIKFINQTHYYWILFIKLKFLFLIFFFIITSWFFLFFYHLGMVVSARRKLRCSGSSFNRSSTSAQLNSILGNYFIKIKYI